MGVNSLPKTATRQRRDCDLNAGPSAPESSTLTAQLPSCGASKISQSYCTGQWPVANSEIVRVCVAAYGDEFHDEEGCGGRVELLDQLDDVAVLQTTKDRHLALNRLLLTSHLRRVDHLQRERQLPRPRNDKHRPRAR